MASESCGVPLASGLSLVGAVFLQRGLNFLDAIRCGCGLPLDGFAFGFARWISEEVVVFFFFLAVVEEVCAAPGWLAADATGAALKRSAAPKIDSTIL